MIACLSVYLSVSHIMPQSHPTTRPVRFSSPMRFLARKAKWSAHRNFTSVLFPWSHQATGPIWLDTSAYLWFSWIIRKTPRVPCAMPVHCDACIKTLRAPHGETKFVRRRMGPMRAPWVDARFLFKTAREQPVRGPGVWSDWGITWVISTKFAYDSLMCLVLH